MNATLTRPAHSVKSPGPDLRTRLLLPLAQLLRQLGDVVARLDDADYVQKPVGVIESSVGGHVRHCLDHVRSLLAAAETGYLNYDARERGTAVEGSRPCAVAQTAALAAALEALPARVLTRPLSVATIMASGAPSVDVLSSVGREVAYVLSHTIHHNAIIGAMVRTLGGRVPDRFGYAPSTVSHLQASGAAGATHAGTEAACVR